MAEIDSKKIKQQLILNLVFVLILILLREGTILFTDMDRRLGEASLSWPTAPGRIIDSEIGKGRIPSGVVHSTRSAMVDTPVPVVHFTFEVDGREYRGDKLAYGTSGWGDEAHVKQLIEKIPTGQTIEVRYDPKNPANSVLLPGAEHALRQGNIISLVLLICIWLSVVVIIGDIGAWFRNSSKIRNRGNAR